MARPRKEKTLMDQVVLEAALQGLEAQKQKLEEQISQVRALLGKRGPGRPKASVAAAPVAAAPAAEKPARKTRVLSAAARKSIAMAQKRRWAEFHKQREAAAKE